jgi:uncharacterized protein YhfF
MSYRKQIDLPPHILSYWVGYLSESGRNPHTPVYDVFHFDDNKSDANELAELVLQGRKLATASLLWEYETGAKRPPKAGDLSVVTDWDGIPLCIIETSEVEVRAFKDVDEEFAAAEGEGDLSLEYWVNAHWAYFERVCNELGREGSPEMPVVCERFRVVFPSSTS